MKETLTSLQNLQIIKWPSSVCTTKYKQIISNCGTAMTVSWGWWCTLHDRLAPNHIDCTQYDNTLNKKAGFSRMPCAYYVKKIKSNHKNNGA